MARHVIDTKKEKALIVGLTTLMTFIGLQALSYTMGIYRKPEFIVLGIAFYIFLVLVQSFIFDLEIKRTRSLVDAGRSFWHSLKSRFSYMVDPVHFWHYQSYLLVPSFIYISTFALIGINPFDFAIKQAWIILSTLAMAVSFWYLKTVFYSHSYTGSAKRQLLFLVKLYTVYISYAAALGVLRFQGESPEMFAVLVFCATFLLVYQAMFRHHNVSSETVKFMVLIAGLIAALGLLVYIYWPVNYFSGALVLTAVYNTVWGLTHHHFMEKNLNRVITYEYLAVLFIVLVLVFSMTNFAERI